ncbi:aminodeoxychorismate/anthranilate synthase component II [Candidatus Micrarchaeota archaeon]|nr:aminodeoxychorismate/anthranilate synthase component II [Candidatus Micrarchaeota archaeon]
MTSKTVDKILIIDNYDSFVYNLFQYVSSLSVSSSLQSKEVVVFRNDAITLDKIKTLKPEAIILSPGPGNPANKRDFGVCADILNSLSTDSNSDFLKTTNFLKTTKILGVCLGHQGIIHYFGGKVTKNKPMHGKTSKIEHNATGLFADLQNPLTVMRYHSLVGSDIPDCLEITARSMDDNVVMGVKHKTLPIYGVQFHPESIMTEGGKKIIENFLRL